MTDVAPRPTKGMLELLNGFVVELRNAGLPVSLTENLDAMEAVQHIPIEDREAFKYALGATLIKNNSHWRSFETVFEVYFSLRGPEYKLVNGDETLVNAYLAVYEPGSPSAYLKVQTRIWTIQQLVGGGG